VIGDVGFLLLEPSLQVRMSLEGVAQLAEESVVGDQSGSETFFVQHRQDALIVLHQKKSVSKKL